MMRWSLETDKIFTGIISQSFLHDNYLCLKIQTKMWSTIKRSDTIILESEENGLMMVVYFSKRNRCHLHKNSVYSPKKS